MERSDNVDRGQPGNERVRLHDKRDHFHAVADTKRRPCAISVEAGRFDSFFQFAWQDGRIARLCAADGTSSVGGAERDIYHMACM